MISNCFLFPPSIPYSPSTLNYWRVSVSFILAERGAFQAAVKARANGALWLVSGSVGSGHQAKIAELAVKSRLPTIYERQSYVSGGGLMSYGVNLPDLHRRTAAFVDKILKGTKPADLPVEQPTKFELVINLGTAKQIGITIPPAVLTRADKVVK
jgi:putative tryptophan/tyrosine transport system substrate-binding protein